MSEIAERVIQIRKENNLSQSQFASKLGLQRTIISLCESGKRDFSERTLRDICSCFDINYDWLKNGIGDKKNNISDSIIVLLSKEFDLDEIDIEIIKGYIYMTPIERQVFKDFIKNIKNKKSEEL